jgi:aldehyde:ferredoxin oxidoreductase
MGGMTSFEVPYVLPVHENGEWKFKNVSGRTLTREGVEKVKTMFYEFEGWDPATGWPTRESLAKLGLDYVADELDKAQKLGKA